MRLHGANLPFTQQGLEKLNDNATKMFIHGTNHKGVEALQQILQKHNRIEFLKDNGKAPPPSSEMFSLWTSWT